MHKCEKTLCLIMSESEKNNGVVVFCSSKSLLKRECGLSMYIGVNEVSVAFVHREKLFEEIEFHVVNIHCVSV